MKLWNLDEIPDNMPSEDEDEDEDEEEEES